MEIKPSFAYWTWELVYDFIFCFITKFPKWSFIASYSFRHRGDSGPLGLGLHRSGLSPIFTRLLHFSVSLRTLKIAFGITQYNPKESHFQTLNLIIPVTMDAVGTRALIFYFTMHYSKWHFLGSWRTCWSTCWANAQCHRMVDHNQVSSGDFLEPQDTEHHPHVHSDVSYLCQPTVWGMGGECA